MRLMLSAKKSILILILVHIHILCSCNLFQGPEATNGICSREGLNEKVKWINLEPDLGIEELAQAKEAYEPDLLLKKYRVYAK